MHHSNSNPSMMAEEATRGIAVEKFDSVKKWGINTYKVCVCYKFDSCELLHFFNLRLCCFFTVSIIP